ncbi:hypothetical protein IKF74_02915 [Candidatus Saccharibacteria bacterium]|nr:hypothetical protein [Candidatus Saccharibacteria bacterium]
MMINYKPNPKSEFTSVLDLILGFFRWDFLSQRKSQLRGDTLIEVMFAVAVFGLGAVGAIALMNTGLASVQNSLETTMARQEIDAQAEALRFIHDAYLTEPNTKSTDGTTGEEISTNNFRNLWQDIVAQAYPPSTVSTSGSYSGGVVSEDPGFFTRTVDNKSNCDTLFTTSTSNGSFGIPSQSFIINPRGLNLLTEKDSTTGNTKVLSHTDIRQNILISAKDTYSSFTTAATYPRLLYGTNNTAGESLTDAFIENNAIKYKSAVTRLDSSEGIWVTAITSNSGLQCYDENGNPEGGIRPDFYDFHIQTCWDSISGNASVISSTVRLFNPDQVNLRKQGMITFDNVEWEKYDNNTNHQGPCSGSDPPEHVIANGTDIEFVGYTRDNMDEGVKYSIADRLYFTLDVDVDTSGILTHPGGEGLTITIGPIKANLTDQGGTITGSDSKTVDAKTFHLQMVRAGNHYTACADSICVEADSDATDVSINYNFKHNGHCCDAISRAKLSNIDMTSNEIDDQTTGGCVRVTPTVTEQEPIIGDDEDSSGPGTQPEPDNPCLNKHPSMQKWTDSLANFGDSTILCDERDGKEYKVTKMYDGKVFMTSDLMFTGSSLEPATSDVTSSVTLDWQTAAHNVFNPWGTYTLPYKKEDYSTVFYNYAAASGMSEVGTEGITEKSDYIAPATAQSICPKNWSLPTPKQFYSSLLAEAIREGTYQGNDLGGAIKSVKEAFTPRTPNYGDGIWYVWESGRYDGSYTYGNARYWGSGVQYGWWRTDDDNRFRPILETISTAVSNAYGVYYAERRILIPVRCVKK